MAERKGYLVTPPFQRLVEVSFLPLLPTPMLWTYNSCENANTALKFGIIDDTVERKQLEVLTAKHRRSLRIALCSWWHVRRI
jgi:hypothetical protein